MEQHQPRFRGYPPVRPPVFIPLGLQTLYSMCRTIYPDQPNPLQVAALVKYWLGGPDPLDYISMYSNPGNAENNIPPHWHYVSFGLSDLHGDGRVHDISGPDTPSGYGFELTFRLRRDPEDQAPPTWPAAIMQALAKYVFQTENSLCAGDHVSWHCPLDNSESRIQHMLMCEDPQLGQAATPFGQVNFVQIVGVCCEELQAAQGWNGPGVIDLMRSVVGPWLVTDMRRSGSMFEMDPEVQAAVDAGIASDGSNLSGVSARCSWREAPAEGVDDELERGFAQISVHESEQIKATLKKGLMGSSKPLLPSVDDSGSGATTDGPKGTDGTRGVEPRAMSQCSRKESNHSEIEEDNRIHNIFETRFFDRVHVQFNLEAGTILLLALRGRLRHGRHFTFKSVVGDVAITLLPVTVSGAFVDTERPLGAHGPWLQVLLTEEDIETLLGDLDGIARMDALALPKTFSWCEDKLVVTLMHEEY